MQSKIGWFGVTLGFVMGVGNSAMARPVLEPEPAWRDLTQSSVAQSSLPVPVASVNPEQPVKINLVNASGQPVEYIMTTYTGFRRLAPGGTAQVSGFALPAYLNINPIRQYTAMQYQVSVRNNVVTVRLLTSNYAGNRSLTIDQVGGIYLY